MHIVPAPLYHLTPCIDKFKSMIIACIFFFSFLGLHIAISNKIKLSCIYVNETERTLVHRIYFVVIARHEAFMAPEVFYFSECTLGDKRFI